MCFPAVGALGGLAVGAAGLGARTAASMQAANAANQAAAYNAQLSMQNAQAAELQAQDALRRGKQRETERRLETSRLEGAQRAAAAGSGVAVTSGSILDNLADTEFFGEQDALDIRRNAELEAFGYRSQASNYRAQAAIQRNRTQSPFLAAAGTVLSGASPLLKQSASYTQNFGGGFRNPFRRG